MGNFLAVQWLKLFVTPWTVVCHAPLSIPRQEYWSSLPFSLPGDLPDPGIEPTSLPSPVLSDGFFTTRATWEALSPGTWVQDPAHGFESQSELHIFKHDQFLFYVHCTTIF